MFPKSISPLQIGCVLGDKAIFYRLLLFWLSSISNSMPPPLARGSSNSIRKPSAYVSFTARYRNRHAIIINLNSIAKRVLVCANMYVFQHNNHIK